ncbi:hypothetical protein COMA2_40100 [Candidatus Nitrospira nitrificans]|uniref:Uncharacterized protein n=1 Tax=Candidatus Nitrospira nitrificans TaxID=1742973 RepID=A0A0S4LN25_9BACT|nr:hypothetical protein COMA2_40100 [Candidatus Nitrospira nitrificans]
MARLCKSSQPLPKKRKQVFTKPNGTPYTAQSRNSLKEQYAPNRATLRIRDVFIRRRYDKTIMGMSRRPTRRAIHK